MALYGLRAMASRDERASPQDVSRTLRIARNIGGNRTFPRLKVIYTYDDFHVNHDFDGQDARLHDPPRPRGDFAPATRVQGWGHQLRSAPQRSPRRAPTGGVFPRTPEEAEPGTPTVLVRDPKGTRPLRRFAARFRNRVHGQRGEGVPKNATGRPATVRRSLRAAEQRSQTSAAGWASFVSRLEAKRPRRDSLAPLYVQRPMPKRGGAEEGRV